MRGLMLVVVLGCGVPRGALGGDAGTNDAASDAPRDVTVDVSRDAPVDAPIVDAPLPDTPLVDAGVVDAPPDAPTDATSADACMEVACMTDREGICAAGTLSCETSICTSDRTPVLEELCGNGVDDNCDGRVDEGGCIDCEDRFREGRLYLLCTDAERWVDARDACDDLDMRIVAIDDEVEQTWIQTQINDLDAPGFNVWWIGLYDALDADRSEGGDRRDQHRWWPDDVEDPAPSFGHWLPGEPNSDTQDCIRIRDAPDRLWTDRECDDSSSVFRYICEPTS